MVQIAEQANKLDPGIRDEIPLIPWKKIKGFRNIAVHAYEYVNAEMVYEIATVEMSFLKNEIEVFIGSSISRSTLSLFELQLSAGSDFYKHVDFKRLME